MTPTQTPDPSSEIVNSLFSSSLKEVILAADKHLKILFASDSISELLGYQASDLTGRPLEEVLHQAGKPYLIRTIQDAIHTRSVQFFDEYKADIPCWCAYRIYPANNLLLISVHEVDGQQTRPEINHDERLMEVLNSLPQGVLVADQETRKFVVANHTICKMLGYTREELLEMSPFTIHPESELERVGREFAQMMAGNTTWVEDMPVLRKDGSQFPVDIHAIQFNLGGRPCICGLFNDISGRKKEAQLQAARIEILEKISSGGSLRDLLLAVISSIEQVVPRSVASVLLLDESSTVIRDCIGPNLPEVYTQAMVGLPIGPKAGSCGTAMYRREPVFVKDILHDPLWEDYQEFTRLLHHRACWSLPILGESGSPLGSFALYYREPLFPTEEEVNLIRQAAHLASMAISKEIREKKLLEAHAQVNESERMLKTARRVARVGNWEVNFQSMQLTFSDEICDLTGLHPTPQDDPEQVFLSLIHPEDRDRVIESFTQHLFSQGEHSSIHRIISQSGEVHYLQEKGFTSFDEEGKPLRTVGVVADITDLKLAEINLQNRLEELRQAKDALRLSHQVLEFTLEGAADGVITVDARQQIIFINTAALRMMGFEKEEVLGKDLSVLFSPEQALSHRNFVSANLSNGSQMAPDHNREFEITRKDGSVFWGQITLSKIINQENV